MSELRLLLWFRVVWAMSLLLVAVDCQSTHPTEVTALQVIRESLVDPENSLSNWRRGDPCVSNWTGVLCFNTTLNDSYLHVRELQLLNLNLSGTLSPAVGRLSYMEILDVMWNKITGSIPREIGQLTNLRLLLLNGNELTGSLPEELGYLPNLDRIQIDQNHISGPIPKSFANLNKTMHFHMNNNSLSGPIPPELSRLPLLVHMLLDNNNLSGSLPPELSELPRLLILQLDNNHFDGTIPPSYGNMSQLLKLSLRNCTLQGPIPDLSRIPKLAYIDLSNNNLNGSIPDMNLSDDITTIDLSRNQLTGSIPSSFSGLPNLQRLSLFNNSLNGSVPSTIWQNRTFNSTQQLILDMENNNISGVSGSLILPPNVNLSLQGNPVCSNASMSDFCRSSMALVSHLQSIPSNSTDNCPASCPIDYEYAPGSPTPCFCAAPLLIGYRLKSPGFSYFQPYFYSFEVYLTSGLKIKQFQLDTTYEWEKGPRLRMQLKIFPEYTVPGSNEFNRSEVLRIRSLFTQWEIPDSEIFGPYELLNFTLLDPYRDCFIFNDIAESSSTQAVSTVYKPQVAASMTPSVDMVFPSIDHAFEFYVTYAKNAGFSVRKGGDYKHGEILKFKYFVCSKEGFKTCKAFDSLEKGKSRNKPSQRTGCNAHIAFSSKDGQNFKVFRFVEEHNHYLVSPEDMQFLPSSRNLTYQQMQVLCNMSKVNMGPVKAFNVMRTIYGGFEQVGATAADFKNFKRDLNLYIGEYDADMVVNMLQKKKEFLPDFYFEYSHDTKRQLTGLFWADEHARRSYKVFGDVVSFDATFNSNKYKMVFVPFTGIDNHCNNITLGAGLLSSETIESYSWLLTCFKSCFGKEPRVVVTDQDPAIKQAVASVLPNSRHRLCMWHIMKKVADKVGTALCNNDDFKQRICDIVWTDSISPEEFEKGWEQLVFDFNLFYHDWLCDIYSNRAMWIPAFYRDEAMSGLMRTTSRSECENHFFGQVSNAQLTLLEFISHFDTAMESQRYTHRKNDHETRYKTPDFWTDYPIEVQAAKIYTRSIFFDVQEEIYGAVHKCINVFLSYEGDIGTFRIKDRSAYGDGLIEVKFNLEDLTILCPCKRFERYGLLCRHAFSVLRLCGINEIPSRYILDRWRSDVICNSPSRSSLSLVMHNDENGDHQSVNDVVRDIMQSSEYIVNKLITDFEKLKLFRDELKAMKEKTDEAGIQRISAKKKEIIQAIIGAPHQTEAAVRVPHGIRNKGCGSRKRFKSKREQAISRAGKRSRNCKVCGGSGHDRRTCDVLKGTVTANNKGKGPVNEADAENSSDSDYEAGDD